MNKNTMYIVVAAIVVIIIIAGVAAYIFLYSGGDGGNGGNGNGGETIYTMGNATSLQFSVISMIQDTTTSLDFSAKNLDNADLMLRRFPS